MRTTFLRQPNLCGGVRWCAGGAEFEDAPEELLSVAEIARVLGLSRATVYKLVERGELVHHRISNAVRVSGTDLDGFLARCRQERQAGPT